MGVDVRTELPPRIPPCSGCLHCALVNCLYPLGCRGEQVYGLQKITPTRSSDCRLEG
jgi:hypothetical protein